MTGHRIDVRDPYTGEVLRQEVLPQTTVADDLVVRLEAVAAGGWRGTAIADLCREAAEAIEALRDEADAGVARG